MVDPSILQLSLIYVEHIRSTESPLGVSNAYRIVGVEPYAHMGTRGRAMDRVDFKFGGVRLLTDPTRLTS